MADYSLVQLIIFGLNLTILFSLSQCLLSDLPLSTINHSSDFMDFFYASMSPLFSHIICLYLILFCPLAALAANNQMLGTRHLRVDSSKPTLFDPKRYELFFRNFFFFCSYHRLHDDRTINFTAANDYVIIDNLILSEIA